MIKKSKEEKSAKNKRKKNKPAVKAKRGKREITELDRMAVRRALMAEVIPAEWLAPESGEAAELEPEEPGAEPAPRKAAEEKAAKRKRTKQKSAAREKPGKRKAAKRKEAKQESAAKEKAGKRRITESELATVKEALALDVVPAAEATASDTEESESRPKKSGRKAADKKAKGKETAKQRRAKQKSAAKEKTGKRKAAEREKIVTEEESAAQAVTAAGPVDEAPEPSESKNEKGGRKAARKKEKEEQAAQRKAGPEVKRGKDKDAEKEKITLRKALLVEPVSVPKAGPQIGASRSPTEEAVGARESAAVQKPAQPVAPTVPPPAAGRAGGGPSRFWPGVALGTVAVIVGFGYIRHLARDQAFPIPRPFVTAESERATTPARPSVADTVIATPKPQAPGAPPESGRTGERAMGTVLRDRAVQGGETGYDSSRPAPVISSETVPARRVAPDAGPKTLAVQPEAALPQPSRAAVSAPAGVSEAPVPETRPETKATPAAPPQVRRPGVSAEMARWQMPWAYQPYRPRFQPVRPGYPMYICPTEPRVLWYPGAQARDGK